MRTYSWFVRGVLEVSPHDAIRLARYKTDGDYKPVAARLLVSEAPTGGPVKVNIKDDGTTIFTEGLAQVDQNSTEKEVDVFVKTESVLIRGGAPSIKNGSILTLSLDAVGTTHGGRDLTVELDLEEVE